MLLIPESTTDLGALREEYERHVECYRYLTNPVAAEGEYAYLMGLLARIRELSDYPQHDYFCGLTPVGAPTR